MDDERKDKVDQHFAAMLDHFKWSSAVEIERRWEAFTEQVHELAARKRNVTGAIEIPPRTKRKLAKIAEKALGPLTTITDRPTAYYTDDGAEHHGIFRTTTVDHGVVDPRKFGIYPRKSPEKKG